MNLQDFKRSIDLECFLLDLGYSLKKEKSSRRTHVYTNGNEHIIVNQKRDVKMYFKPDGDKGPLSFLTKSGRIIEVYQGSIYSRIYQKLADYAQLSNRSSIDTLINFEQKIPFHQTILNCARIAPCLYSIISGHVVLITKRYTLACSAILD